MKKLNRRTFLGKGTKAAVLGSAAAIFGCREESKFEAPAVQSKKKHEWKMVTTWPPHFPVMGTGAELIAETIEEMSDGQIKVDVFGGGELIPALETFEAVSQGIVEMGHGASYYWAGKIPASPFFSAVPFGMNAQQMNAWLYSGGGLALWEELYAPFDIVPMPGGNTGTQMGGWFNKKISSIHDINGLKMRIPGLGGKVIRKAGGTAVLSAGGEIYTNLERGVIDATEWVGPYHDYLLGLHQITKYYYYPGWHEPGTVLELLVNKSVFEDLPKHLKSIVRTAAYRANLWMLSEFESKNNEYLQKITNEHKVSLIKFPDDVLSSFERYAEEVLEELIENDEMSKRIYHSFFEFRQNVSAWAKVSELVYYTTVNTYL